MYTEKNVFRIILSTGRGDYCVHSRYVFTHSPSFLSSLLVSSRDMINPKRCLRKAKLLESEIILRNDI